MRALLRNFYATLKEACTDFVDDHCTKLSASLAYYTIFSIGPLLLVVITLVGLFYKKTLATAEVFEHVGAIVGQSVATQLESLLTNISAERNTTIFGLVGGVVFIFGATGIFTEIQSSINYIWSIKAKPEKSWLKYITDRLMSFLFVIGLGLVMIASLLLNVVMDILITRLHNIRHLQRLLGKVDVYLLKGINVATLFVIATFLFGIIYKVLPDAKVRWRDALVGAAFGAVLFLLGKVLIGYYLSNSHLINSYGAAASMIILLSWIYYSAIILYLGAEFTKVYAMKWGGGITVTDTGVYIIKREAKELPDLKHPVPEN